MSTSVTSAVAHEATTTSPLRTEQFDPVSRSRALSYLPSATLGVDLVVVSVSTALAALVAGAASLDTLAVAGPAVAAVWMVCLVVAGGYAANLVEVGTDELRRVATASLGAAGAVGVACLLLDYALSRGFFLATFALGAPALLLGRLVLRQLVQRARATGALQHNVIIVGSRAGIDEVASVVMRERRLGYQVLGCLTPPPAEAHDAPETTTGVPVLGTSDAIVQMVEASGADTVFFADCGLATSAEMRRVTYDLAQRDVHVVVAPSLSGVSGDRVSIRPVGGLPFMHLDPPRATEASRRVKRLLDMLGSFSLLLLILPVIAFAAARIKLHDGGPVLFRQVRVGRDGREFSVLKFRTMVLDAEQRLAALHAETGYAGGLFKMVDDPRITKPGHWLRRFSIDELPQLVNILRGDMSLVGPRPPLPLEVAQYDTNTSRRLHVRPGLTGLWQVSGRSNLSFDEAIRLDLYYVDNWSMLQDFSILTKTFGAVVRPSGAY